MVNERSKTNYFFVFSFKQSWYRHDSTRDIDSVLGDGVFYRAKRYLKGDLDDLITVKGAYKADEVEERHRIYYFVLMRIKALSSIGINQEKIKSNFNKVITKEDYVGDDDYDDIIITCEKVTDERMAEIQQKLFKDKPKFWVSEDPVKFCWKYLYSTPSEEEVRKSEAWAKSEKERKAQEMEVERNYLIERGLMRE